MMLSNPAPTRPMILAPFYSGADTSLADYPDIPWDRMDLDQFNLMHCFPKTARRILSRLGMKWQSFHLIPIESGRGCPYGCEFCTVTVFLEIPSVFGRTRVWSTNC
jgi:radical SAM superfamily enzyme YgiQ (UPF0313 family)